jgi:hypothetical protein
MHGRDGPFTWPLPVQPRVPVEELAAHPPTSWNNFAIPDDRSLVEGLRLCGFAVERVDPRFLPSSMSQGWTPPIAFLRLYLRCPAAWRWFGRQFLVVARRP